MNPAAVLSVLVQARGIEETNRQLRKIDVSSRRTADSTQNLEKHFARAGSSASAASEGMGQLSVRVGALGGSLGSMVPLLATATPALVALGGAAAAVAGSLGAAAAGAGALGVGLAASLAPVLVVGKQVTSRFEEIKKAYELVKTAQREGTAESKKNAEQALAGLSKSERAMVKSFGKISDLQKKVLGPASDMVIGSLSKAIDTLAPSLSKLAKPFEALGFSIGANIERVAKVLSGKAWTGALKKFVENAQQLIVPVTTVFIGIANIVRDVALAALPLVTDAVRAVARAFNGLDKDATKTKIGDVVRGLVDQTKSWFGLFMQVGELIFRVFSGGASQGKGFVDALTGIVGKWNDFLESAKGQDAIKTFFDVTVGAVRAFGRVIGIVVGAVRDAVGAIIEFSGKVKDAFLSVKDTAVGLFHDFQEGETAISGIVGALGGIALAVAGVQAYGFAVKIVAGATKAWAAAQAIFNALFVASPIGLIVLALAALGAAFVIAYKKSETFRDIVNGAWASIKDAAAVAFDWLKTNVPAAFDAIKNAAGPVLDWLKGAFKTVVDEVGEWKLLFAVVATVWKVYFAILSAQVKGIVATVVTVFKVGMAVLGPIVSGAWDGIKEIFRGAVKVIAGIIKVFGGVLKGDLGQIWDGVKEIFSGAWDVVKGIVRAALGAIVGYLKAVPPRILSAATSMGKAVAEGILSGMGSLGHLILDKVKDALDFVGDNLPGPLGAAAKIGSSIAGKIGDGAGSAAKASLPSGAGLSGGSLMGAKSIMAPFASMAGRFGLHTSSGLRPGAITSSGNPSYHGTGNAVDEAGSPAGMLGYFKYLRSNFGSRLRELIYTPGGVGIKDGKPFRYTGQVAADHFDHVHVAFTGGAGDGIGRAPRTGDGIGQIKALWTKAGGSASAQNLAAAVAMAESGGNASITNSNSDGSIDRGLWQINSVHGSLSTLDRMGNARAAVKISSNGRNWNPWVAYTNGSYKRFLGTASKTKATSVSTAKGKTYKKNQTASGGALGGYDPSAVYATENAATLPDPFTGMLGGAAGFAQRMASPLLSATRPLKGGGPTKGISTAEGERRANLPAGPTAADFLNANVARARLTDSSDDDIAALGALLDLRRGEMNTALSDSDPRNDADAIDAFLSVKDALDTLTEAANANTAAIEEQRKQYEMLIAADYRSQFNVSQSQYGILAQAITDVVNGRLGSTLGLGLSGLRAAPGAVARS